MNLSVSGQRLLRNMSSLTIDLDFVFEKSDKLLLNGLIYREIRYLDRVVRRQFFIIEGDPFNLGK
ncbi:MAG: hypothetical protein CM15mP85_28810 [Rhodobacterales bacterium]|nr:MAG: hypothetical protein CM15mP85_28810 [Rhodobacterales bacterium]